MLRLSRAAFMACICVTVSGLVILNIGVVPRAAAKDAESVGHDAVVSPPGTQTALIDQITRETLDALAAQQREDGSFKDPTSGTVGRTGLPQVVFAAAHAARSEPDPVRRDRWLEMADRSLRRGTVENQVLSKWALALLVSEGGIEQLGEKRRAQILAKLNGLGRVAAPGVAQRCFVRPDCFNNYKLFETALDAELLDGRAQLVPKDGSRLSDPVALRARVLRELMRLPAQTVPSTVQRFGRAPQTARLLSDPPTRPLAYVALSTALLMRTDAQLGRPPGQMTAQILRGMMSAAAPNGEISWMGRGQDQAWTLAASTYAALAGARTYARSSPELAAQLRGLATVQLAALRDRLGPIGLAQTSLERMGGGQRGIDHYASQVGNAALAVLFLQLARADADQGEESRFTAQVNRARLHDHRGANIITLRTRNVWIGVHTTRNHATDGRYDLGLLRAMYRRGDHWRQFTVQQPARHPVPPTITPMDRSGNRFRVRAARSTPTSVVLSGTIGETPMVITYRPLADRIRVTLSCSSDPRRAVRLTFFSRRDPQKYSRRLILDSEIRFSRPFRIDRPGTKYASARHQRLNATVVWTRCTGHHDLFPGDIAPG